MSQTAIQARIAALTAHKTLGEWLEEAIKEKRKRESRSVDPLQPLIWDDRFSGEWNTVSVDDEHIVGVEPVRQELRTPICDQD